jgi:hypothetical protein
VSSNVVTVESAPTGCWLTSETSIEIVLPLIAWSLPPLAVLA